MTSRRIAFAVPTLWYAARMVTCRENGAVLLVIYRSGVVGAIGALLVAIGALLVAISAREPFEATLRCAGGSCALERVGLGGTEREPITGLRGATAKPELVLHADRDVLMGPLVAKRAVQSYLAAEQRITAYVAGGARGDLVATVPVSGTLRLLEFGALFLVFGLSLATVFAIGARTALDRRRDEVRRYRSRLRAKLSNVRTIEVRGNRILATLDGGRELAIVSVLDVRTRNPPAPRRDLEAAAARIRAFVGA